MISTNKIVLALVFLTTGIAGCTSKVDKDLKALIEQNHLQGEFVADKKATDKQKIELGGLLFFSPDLSIDGSVSCASCHHPTKAGGDGIPLPIGIGGVDSKNIGQQRIDAAAKSNGGEGLEGLIPRNTPTVINSALYREVLFWDGRLQYDLHGTLTGKRQILTGFGVAQYNPSNYFQENLLQTQARLPMSSAFEMKGGLASEKNNQEIEQSVLALLKSNPFWCEKFALAYNEKDCEKAINLNNLTIALGEFESSLIYINSPFEKYTKGDKSELNEEQKKGAVSFLMPIEKGGAGCVSCHAGKTFTNEKFYNIGLPASGRGANDAGWDLGRNNVDRAVPKFSFRTPDLLNVEMTAPYFHNGTALTLEEAIKAHALSPAAKNGLVIVKLGGVDYDFISKAITEEFIKHPEITALLPKSLAEEDVKNLAAFLRSLTDPCLKDEDCYKEMNKDIIETKRQGDSVSQQKAMVTENVRSLNRAKINMPVFDCKENKSRKVEKKQFDFSIASSSGINHARKVGLIRKGWLIDVVNYSSVSAMDVDYDCLDDLVFDAGENGIFFYKQMPDGSFVKKELPVAMQDDDVNALTMDVDGDYKFDLFVGNLGKQLPFVAFDFINGKDIQYRTKLAGPVINASIADIDNDGDMDLTFAMWRSFNTLRQEHIWINDGNGNFTAQYKLMDLYQDPQNRRVDENEFIQRITPLESGAADLTFTPNYADIDGDGDDDLLLAADFFRSQILTNNKGNFTDITDKKVVDDNNGMGAAVADFDNDGDMDWFVSSVKMNKLAWINGHRVYVNQGKGVFTKQAIGEKDEWSWGSCAKDFNNDGYVDIFYISGFGEFLDTATYETEGQKNANEAFFAMVKPFSNSTPSMFINDGKGGFTNESEKLGFNGVFNGRGISCFDYQQDGDIDIIVAPLEGMPRLYINNLNGSKNWLSIRLLGLPGNTEAIGTKVTLYTGKGMQYREVMYENNFISRNPAQLHFGLGDEDKFEKLVIDVPSPHKKQIVLTDIKPNQLTIIKLADYL